MKKSKTKLAISKKTVASLENIMGGRNSFTSESCPGDQCPTKAKTCVKEGPCNDTIQDA